MWAVKLCSNKILHFFTWDAGQHRLTITVAVKPLYVHISVDILVKKSKKFGFFARFTTKSQQYVKRNFVLTSIFEFVESIIASF